MNNSQSSKHIVSLTSLRGIAALLVMLHHYFYFLLPRIGPTLEPYTMFFFNGYLWVDFFFILSGFVLTHAYIKTFSLKVSQDSYRAYFISRIARIYPLHLFMLFLFFSSELLRLVYIAYTGGEVNAAPFTGIYSLSSLIGNLWMVQALDFSSPPLFDVLTTWNQPAWSISAEWLVYLFFPFLLFDLTKCQNKTHFLIYGIALVSLFLLIIFTYGHLNFLGLWSLVRCALEAILGMTIYKIYQSGSYRHFFSFNSTLIISILSIFLVMHYDWNDWFSLLPFCLLILSTSVKRGDAISNLLAWQPIIYFGEISYSIYMTHWFVQETAKRVWKIVFDKDLGMDFNFLQTLTMLFVCVVIVIGMASLTYKLIEMPSRYYLKNKFLTKKYIG
ncbi:MAG: acyltransferase [Hydrococcus sp. CRU_1_1]|nr:acyltransferase [Hydrococcus sp. CRU_1_1]